MTTPIPTPSVPAPDIVRCAYMEIVVTDLARSREFYVGVLGLHVTEEDDDAIYLRSLEEFIHHNLVLRRGPVAAVAAFAYRVKSPAEVDAAEAQEEPLPGRAPFPALAWHVAGELARAALFHARRFRRTRGDARTRSGS